MVTTSHQICIIGGGPAGLTLAHALGQAGVNVALVERQSLQKTTLPAFDGRTTALTATSKNLYSALGLWDALAPEAGPIYDIRIIDNHSPLTLHYDHKEVGEPMGHIVENRRLRSTLLKAIKTHKTVTIYDEQAYTDITFDDARASVTLDSGTTLTAQLVVACDGKQSRLREQMGLKTTRKEYDQTAIVCTIRTEKPHHGVAVEHFFPGGPFAVLPMKDEHLCSIVWTEHSADAARYLEQPNDTLERELETRMESFLGTVSIEGKVFNYPLSLVAAMSYTRDRFALVGDAAHGIHPIAGQGFNLGLRDVAVLAEMVVERARLGLDVGSAGALADYTRNCLPDHALMVAATDSLNRLFSNDIWPIEKARRAGLAGVQKTPPLKRFFMRHAMGERRKQPKLLAGSAL